MTPTLIANPRTRFTQISLRTLMALVLITGGGLSWIVHRAKFSATRSRRLNNPAVGCHTSGSGTSTTYAPSRMASLGGRNGSSIGSALTMSATSFTSSFATEHPIGRYLDVSGSKCTAAGVDDLQDALPSMSIRP